MTSTNIIPTDFASYQTDGDYASSLHHDIEYNDKKNDKTTFYKNKIIGLLSVVLMVAMVSLVAYVGTDDLQPIISRAELTDKSGQSALRSNYGTLNALAFSEDSEETVTATEWEGEVAEEAVTTVADSTETDCAD